MTAAGAVGPRGNAAGAVWGPGGHGVAAARGPYGNRYYTNLPNGALHHSWHGNDYWHVGFGWYSPYWVGDSMYYAWAYPPVGYYYSSLPTDSTTVVVNNTTYYESEGVYYQEGQQDGQKGYVVVEAPDGAGATTQAAGAPAAEGSTGAPAAEIPEGPNPFVVLKAMCDYVAGLEKFSAVASTTSDEVNESGNKIQLSGRREIWVSRPNKWAFNASGDKGTRRSVYDGKTVTLFDRTKNVYSAIEAPGTIENALDTLAAKYGIVFPLEDLLYTDLYKKLEARIQAGQYLGVTRVSAWECHHLAFSTEKADVELWVDASEQPVPRRISIDYRGEGPRSRYSADFVEWNSAPTFIDETFGLKLPDDVKRIEIAQK